MNNFPSKEAVEALQKRFPAGTQVELVCMEDPYTSLKPGDKGVVRFIDSTGTLFCDWENGSGLGVVMGVDIVRKLQQAIQEGE